MVENQPDLQKESTVSGSLLLPWMVVLGVTAAFSMPVFYANIFFPERVNDFKDHILFARDLMSGTSIPAHILAHALLQVLTILGHRILNLSLENVTLAIMVAANLLTSAVLFAYLRRKGGAASPWPAVVAALGMLAAAPLALFVFQDEKFYLGYVGVISYHNPTIILLRPLALINFLCIPAIFSDRPVQPALFAAAALTSILAAAVKPSYTICVIPILAVAVLWALPRKKSVRWGLLTLGYILPAVGILAWQFLTTYGTEEAGIIWAPFEVMHTYAPTGLLPRFLLSIWFPLVTLALFYKQAAKNQSLVFAWLIFLTGCFYTYFLAESGLRFIHGNFGWSGEIGLFILFCATFVFLLKEGAEEKPRFAAAWLAGFLPHLIFGLAYYFHTLSSPLFF